MTLFYESVARVLILHIEAEARQTQAGCNSTGAHYLFCQYMWRLRSVRESTIISFCDALIGPLTFLFLTTLIASIVFKWIQLCVLMDSYIIFYSLLSSPVDRGQLNLSYFFKTNFRTHVKTRKQTNMLKSYFYK